MAKHLALNDRKKNLFFNMVDLTTAIIFQYVYSIPQKAKCFAMWKFERRKWNLISSYDRGKSPRFSDYNQIGKKINNISYFMYYLRVFVFLSALKYYFLNLMLNNFLWRAEGRFNFFRYLVKMLNLIF
jgi:hypothetical protein